MIEIDSGIPLPPAQRGASAAKFPFQQMKIGDSFFLAGKKKDWGMHRMAKYHGVKITTRIVTENGVEGIRVWRIADAPKLRAVK